MGDRTISRDMVRQSDQHRAMADRLHDLYNYFRITKYWRVDPGYSIRAGGLI